MAGRCYGHSYGANVVPNSGTLAVIGLAIGMERVAGVSSL